MDRDECMLEAILEAETNIMTGEGGPFGAVIVKDGVIAGRGRSCVLSKKDPTCHAEMEAIRDAARRLSTHDLSGCVMYTSSMPCPMCLAALMYAGIRDVYYGNPTSDVAALGFKDGTIYEYFTNGVPEEAMSFTQLSPDMAAHALHVWDKLTDKKLY